MRTAQLIRAYYSHSLGGAALKTVILNGQPVWPSKVICVGKNYAAHIEEMASVPAEDMVVFMKPATSIGRKLNATLGEPLHYEGEICLLIKDRAAAGVGFGLGLMMHLVRERLCGGGMIEKG